MSTPSIPTQRPTTEQPKSRVDWFARAMAAARRCRQAQIDAQAAEEQKTTERSRFQ